MNEMEEKCGRNGR